MLYYILRDDLNMENNVDVISLYDLDLSIKEVLGVLRKANYQQSVVFTRLCDLYKEYKIGNKKLVSKIRRHMLSTDTVINTFITVSSDNTKLELRICTTNKKVIMEVERVIGGEKLLIKTKHVSPNIFDSIKDDVSCLFDLYEQVYKVKSALKNDSLLDQKFERTDSVINFHMNSLGSYINVSPKSDVSFLDSDLLRKTFVRFDTLNDLYKEVFIADKGIQRKKVNSITSAPVI